MLKYAFVVRVEGENPTDSSAVYVNSESHNTVAAVDSLEMGKEYVKGLIDDGYTLINLCGYFKENFVKEIEAYAGPDVKIRNTRFVGDEKIKREALPAIGQYAAVIVMRGVEQPHKMHLDCDAFDCNFTFVKDLDQAKAAAKELADGGASLVELCSWFHKDETAAVVDAVDGKLPVGSCGDI